MWEAEGFFCVDALRFRAVDLAIVDLLTVEGTGEGMPGASEVHFLEDRIAVDRVRVARVNPQPLSVQGFHNRVAPDIGELRAVVLEVPEVESPAGHTGIAEYRGETLNLFELSRHVGDVLLAVGGLRFQASELRVSDRALPFGHA